MWWLIPFGALWGGLALTLWLSAMNARLSAGQIWLRRWLAFMGLNLALGLMLAGCRGEATPTPAMWREVTDRMWQWHTASPATPPPARVTVSAPGAPTPAGGGLALESPAPVGDEFSLPAPARLRIPALGVDEVIRSVPIHDGQWDLSNLGLRVGQLTTTGARPGDEWAMVFVGHMTLTTLARGPFADLQHIPDAAEVIYSVDGQVYVYQVREKWRVPPDEVQQLYVRDARAVLLVTCTDWDPDQHMYANRLLVRAELVSAPESMEGSH